ncbi:SMI1/KNR4 family protein [Streptomyces sp. NPDC048142]|uniref:SMI1/KNR4 family protein n=1 Tax=Streptomyces sp. NPDC048142 TaxID=3365501 RepID=UPI003711E84D
MLSVDTPARKGHQVENSRFHEILGEPQVNSDAVADWEVVERAIGMTLPDDYKDFVSAYGPGCINDQIYLFHPRGERGDHGLRLGSLWDQAAYSYGELARSDPDSYPYSVYPEKGGCIAVARSISGNHVLLVPPDEENTQWRVAVDMGGWVLFAMSFGDFLWAALHEELPVPVIQGEPSFEQVGGVGFE